MRRRRRKALAADDMGSKASGDLENGCDGAVEEEEGVVTMTEVIEGLEAQELEADLVLGGDEGKECTYSKGYLARQAVFSCLTCCPEGNAGVCTACSITCHDGHDVVELWTRRHFRCDCGNSKFGVGVCRLFSSKDAENSENVYNQNHKGVYCTCKRPYPDPDGEDQGEMLQCCICEDWFHETHLGLDSEEQVPRDEDGEPLYDELICQACAAHLDFLTCYKDLLVAAVGLDVTPNEDATVEKEFAVMQEADKAVAFASEGTPVSQATVRAESKMSQCKMSAEHVPEAAFQSCEVELHGRESLSRPPFEDLGSTLPKEELMVSDGSASGKIDCLSQGLAGASYCKLDLLKSSGQVQRLEEVSGKIDESNNEVAATKVKTNKSLFLVKNWRAQLCHCYECCKLYLEKGVSFLLDSKDTLFQYEETAKQKRKEKMEATERRDLTLFNSLGHVGQIELIHNLNDMASEFSSHFASFGESGRTVTSDDIHEFFDNLKRKRTRLV